MVILVTGASGGIGAAAAKELKQRGHTVYGTYRRNAPEAPEFIPLYLDVNDEQSVQAAIDRVLAEQGRLDVLLNNAGMGIAGPLELPEGEYAAMTNHVVCDKFFTFFTDRGVRDFPESDTTRKRRSRLVNLIEAREGQANFDEVIAFLEKRYPDTEGSIWNDRTIVLSAACPMKDKTGFWLRYPTMNDRFERVDIIG